MKMFLFLKRIQFPFLAGLGLMAGSLLNAQSAGQLETIAVSEVKVTTALTESVRRAGKLNELQRVTQALDGQLMDALHSTRKFNVIARSDLNAILREQEFAASGNVDLNSSGAAQRFQVAGVKYLVVPGVDDFQDHTETRTFEGLGRTVSRRIVRIGGVARIYNTTTGQLLETANFQVSNDDLEEASPASRAQGSLNEGLLANVSRELATRVAVRVEDVIFPARVLAKTGNQVTFSRGDGSTVAVNQIWEVYATGEELIDPDTGVSLGANEVPVGRIRVNGVRPRFSTGMILEDFGIDKGAIVRQVVTD